ncbi:MAG: ChaN family lipoprotein [Thermoanaerobaculia bacterium]|nr:ChaN family lipoprotein [Thermoanaerobaculia bacterium]
MRRALCTALLLAFAASSLRADDAALDLPLGDPARREKTLAPSLDVVLDARAGAAVSPAEVAARLAKARLVFLGESHTNAEFHRVQLQVIRELARAGRRVLVGLEMYPATEQVALDLWNAGALSEAEFLEKSDWYRNWGYHWDYYRDIFRFCREAKVTLHAVNVPRELVSDVRKKGFDGLTAEQKALLPPRIDTENADHLRLLKAFFGDEGGMHSASMPEAMWQGMFRAQCTWDAAMAWNAAQALQKANDPNAVMVVLIGSGHVAYGLGAERQARLWFDGGIASVIPIPVLDEKDRPVKVRASYADFVWGVPQETDPLFPVLGLSTRDPKDGSTGWPVINVAKDSVAEAAGFRVGDVLLAMDGTPLGKKGLFNRLMSEKRWSDTASYEVKRGEEKVTLVAKFVRKPKEAPKAEGPAK